MTNAAALTCCIVLATLLIALVTARSLAALTSVKENMTMAGDADDEVFVYYLDLGSHNGFAYDGETMRYDRGISGTHTAAIVVMEQLKVNFPGARCIIVDPSANDGKSFRGVAYATDVGRAADATILITSVQMSEHSMAKLPVEMPRLKALVMVSQVYTIVFDVDAFVKRQSNRKKIKVGMVYLNHWCEKYLLDNDRANRAKLVGRDLKAYIPNPLVSDCLPELSRDALARDWSFQFYASFERGGALAGRVVCSLPPESAPTMTVMSYVNLDVGLACDRVSFVGSQSKTGVFQHMSNARCFLYPLVLPNGAFHKDTAAACVVEALACGVRVMTYPQSALKELYGTNCDWIPPPSNATLAKIQDTDFWVDCSELNSDDNVRSVAEFVAESLADDDLDRRMRTAEDVRRRFGAERVGIEWSAFLRRLL